MPHSEPPPPNSDAAFQQDLAEVERSLQALKDRYSQVQHDQTRQTILRDRRDRLQPTPELRAELERLQTQLDELEVSLETRLFTWGSLREPFWQMIRFGGVGMAIGWLLAFTVLNSPQPTPTPPRSEVQK